VTIDRSVCSACAFAGGPERRTPGSTGVEIVLWLFLAVPGLIYSLWRMSSATSICPACKRDALLPIGTPRGAELLAGRGGWQPGAERHFREACRSDFYRAIPWTIICWFWFAAWTAIGATTLSYLSCAVAVVATLGLILRFPRPGAIESSATLPGRSAHPGPPPSSESSP
jgi:hypothetical protein